MEDTRWRVFGKFLVAVTLWLGVPEWGYSSPQSLTYQGRILRFDGVPLSYGNVSFLFEIANPTGSCVIYRELVEGVNMANSQGMFDVAIGSGVRQFPTTPTYKLSDVFVNSIVHSCYGGASYTALADDVRVLKVQFYDGSGWRQISPSNVIRSVPFSHSAYSASKLGTLGVDDFIQKTNVPGAACSAGQVITFDGNNFTCVADGGGGGGFVLTNDSRLSDARSPVGSAGGDLGGVYPNPQVAKIQATSVSATAPSGAGQVLRYDGTTHYVPAYLNISDLRTNTAAPQFPAASCGASQALTYSSVTDQFTCTTIAISASQVTSGAVDVANGGTGSVSLPANSVLLGNGVSALQAVAPGASGNILTSDGSSWVSQVPSVTVPSDVWVEKTSHYTASAGDFIFANTSGGAFTITLPASPTANDVIRIVDNSQSFNLNALTIHPNGSRFSGGAAKPWIQNTQGRTLTLTYQNATYGWVVTEVGSVTVPPPFTTWNPADKAAALVLSNSYRDVTSTGGSWNSVRGVTSKDSGKWYYECHMVAVKSGTPEAMFGVANSVATLSGTYIGASVAGRGYQVQGGFTYGGTYTGSKPAFAAGDVVGMALDITGNTLSIYKNNVYQGQFTSLPTAPLFPGASIATDVETKIRLVTLGAHQTYAPPAGFTAWDE